MDWMLYILIFTATGGVTSSTIKFADEKACETAKREFSLVISQLPINPHPWAISVCMPSATQAPSK